MEDNSSAAGAAPIDPVADDCAFTPTGAANLLVTVYGHRNWQTTGLEEMALFVAREFLAQQPGPRETVPHYGSGPQGASNVALLDEFERAVRKEERMLLKAGAPTGYLHANRIATESARQKIEAAFRAALSKAGV